MISESSCREQSGAVALDSPTLRYFPVPAECKVWGALALPELEVAWVSCSLLGHSEALGVLHQGNTPTTVLPAVVLVGLLGGFQARSWDLDVALMLLPWGGGSPRGLGHSTNPAGAGFLGTA